MSVSNADGFIVRLDELIAEGEALLHTRGTPKKVPPARNAILRSKGVTFDRPIPPEDQLLRTPDIPTLDYDRCATWINEVYLCFSEYRGKEDSFSIYFEQGTRLSYFTKNDVKAILVKIKASRLNASKANIDVTASGIGGGKVTNRIILIGNGFDLAHDLKTGYTHFIEALWEKEKNGFINSLDRNRCVYPEDFTQNDFIQIKCSHPMQMWFLTGRIELSGFSFFSHLEGKVDFDNKYFGTNYEISVHWNNDFLHTFSKKIDLKNWVDIEREYFLALHECAKQNGDIKKLNNEFKRIKDALEIYLNSLSTGEKEINGNIARHFYAMNDEMLLENKSAPSDQRGSLRILNFNYTPLASKYLQDCFKENEGAVELIPIHGELGENENPILFGYGDTAGTEYSLLKERNVDNPGYLENIKPMKHFQTTYYQQLLDYVESGGYEVHIMGHSCGISDRDMLKMLFEHSNCLRIRIYYYNQDDYFQKTENISMCFSEHKTCLEKTDPFPDCVPLS